MSKEKHKRHRFGLDAETYKLYEVLAEKDGLTVDEEVEVALLQFFKVKDPKLFEEAKRVASLDVLRVFQKYNP